MGDKRVLLFMRLRSYYKRFFLTGPCLSWIIIFADSVTSAIVDVATAIDSELCGLANVECLQEKRSVNCNPSETFVKAFSCKSFPLAIRYFALYIRLQSDVSEWRGPEWRNLPSYMCTFLHSGPHPFSCPLSNFYMWHFQNDCDMPLKRVSLGLYIHLPTYLLHILM